MLSQTIGELLPVAAALALSPIPIVAVILVLDSAKGRVNGPAFAAGWLVGITGVCVRRSGHPLVQHQKLHGDVARGSARG